MKTEIARSGSTCNIDYLVSIVVPCYNCHETLDRTVDSLLRQNIIDCALEIKYQIVLVDDGSTDDTLYKCNKYADEYPNVKAIHKKNGGLVDAWKNGVRESNGKYIAFCDADDYIESDFASTIIDIIVKNEPDVIAYGMVTEYDNGEMVTNDILLRTGLYDVHRIRSEVLPVLLSDGDMQTDLILSSRCNKVFKKDLLVKIMDDVPDDISMGEDDATCLATSLNMKNIYSIQGYCPYHYLRNTASMIGAYDEKTFSKIDKIYDTLKNISQKYYYPYSDQVEKRILSILLLYIKKEICKNNKGYKAVKKKLEHVRESETFITCYDKRTVKHYSLSRRIFANLFYYRLYGLLWIITKSFEGVRGRNV